MNVTLALNKSNSINLVLEDIPTLVYTVDFEDDSEIMPAISVCEDYYKVISGPDFYVGKYLRKWKNTFSISPYNIEEKYWEYTDKEKAYDKYRNVIINLMNKLQLKLDEIPPEYK